MSANPADEALERLNYFNGQRLAATDFRAEQGYHLGMRRVLNHALYSPGIVAGLMVLKDKNDKHRVIVTHGLAFDHLGREIFVPQDVFVQAMGAPSTKTGVVFGNLLVVSYREQRKHPVSDGCAVAAPCTPCSGDLAWGAPSRIAAEAVFEFLDSWPADDSGRIVLAQIELSKTCEVVRVLPGVRKYAVPVKPQTVRALSLEGEKDIDKANPKVLYFHIDGGAPEAVTLYLRSRQFPSLYYTEMGKHSHAISTTLSTDTHDFVHSHTVTGGKTTKNGIHKHALLVNDDAPAGLDDETNEMFWRDNIVADNGEHEHDLKDIALANNLGPYSHSHTLTASSARMGVSDTEVRKPVAPAVDTFALTHLRKLRVIFDGTEDITNRVLTQLSSKPGMAGKWPSLGDTGLNMLASIEGTDEIDLLKIPGIEIGLGRHTLTFRVDEDAVGGTLQYNLYVS
jgi:hypothetical protein